MSDLSNILLRLIGAAERVVCCRGAVDGELTELIAQRGEIKSPVGMKLSGAHDLLIDALRLAGIFHGDPLADDERRARWSMIIGVLLPMVRDDLGRVIELRRVPLESDSEQYRMGGGMPRDNRHPSARR